MLQNSKFVFVLCAVATCGLPPAAAATKEGAFSVRGIGAETCSTFTERLSGNGRQQALGELASWIGGYLSSANRQTENAFEVMPISNNVAVAALAADICKNNTDALVDTVVTSLVDAFANDAMDGDSPLMNFKSGKYSTVMRAALVESVQKKLVEKGYLEASDVDGKFGTGTSKAIGKFQKSNGLLVTGVPDPLTLMRLLAKTQS